MRLGVVGGFAGVVVAAFTGATAETGLTAAAVVVGAVIGVTIGVVGVAIGAVVGGAAII